MILKVCKFMGENELGIGRCHHKECEDLNELTLEAPKADEFIVRKLKAWREEAQPERKQIQCPDGKKGCLVMHFSQDLFDTPEKQTIRKLIDALLIYEDAMDSILGQMELVNDHPIEVVLKAREANAKVEELFK
jgi:hypothetical protein